MNKKLGVKEPENANKSFEEKYAQLISLIMKHRIPFWERRNCKSSIYLNFRETEQWKYMTEEVRWTLLRGIAVDFDIKGKESILEKAIIFFGEPLVEKWGDRMLGYVKDLRFKNSAEFTS